MLWTMGFVGFSVELLTLLRNCLQTRTCTLLLLLLRQSANARKLLRIINR